MPQIKEIIKEKYNDRYNTRLWLWKSTTSSR